MTYNVIISDSAFKDLESIKSFISIDNINAATHYIEKIFDKLESLSTFPSRGIKIRNSLFDYARSYYLVCLNHIAIYQIYESTKTIFILRILSHFQGWKDIVNKELLNTSEKLIDGNRLYIAKMNQSMYYDVFRNSQDEDNRKFSPDEVFESLEEASEVVDQIIKNYGSENGPFVYAIIRKEDNANIGYVQLVKIKEGWEIGYHIAKLFTKKGYATEAVNLFLGYLKKSTNLKEVYGVVLENNKASLRVLDKCGFKVLYSGDGIYQGKRRKIVKTIKQLFL